MEKRDSAACLEMPMACLDMSMDICNAFLPPFSEMEFRIEPWGIIATEGVVAGAGAGAA